MVLISPFTKRYNNKPNAKEYPYWKELIELIRDNIIQVGIDGETQLVKDFRKNLTMKEIEDLLKDCDYWISIDTYLQHLAHNIGKNGVVLWGTSDPNIFGYSNNINIIKDRKYLRNNQFNIWNDEIWNPDTFVEAREVYRIIMENINGFKT